jgi:uncharacterized protein with NRDE domain
VIAANRDEDHERPARAAHFWEDAPEVLGGRDALLGGSWLAITRSGRFAAVTNLHGAERRSRSRGFLVSSFVTSDATPVEYAASIEREEYSGFHLLVGEVGGTVMYVASDDEPRILEPGIYGFSNARSGEHWPKVDAATSFLSSRAKSRDLSPEPSTHARDDIADLLQFLRTPRNRGRVEEEVFIAGDRYGTRASTVVVATKDELLFAEQNYSRGGVVSGEPSLFSFRWSSSG